MGSHGGPTGTGMAASRDKSERLAAALKANLARRKAQARARRDAGADKPAEAEAEAEADTAADAPMAGADERAPPEGSGR